MDTKADFELPMPKTETRQVSALEENHKVLKPDSKAHSYLKPLKISETINSPSTVYFRS